MFLSTLIHELGHYILLRRWREAGTDMQISIGTGFGWSAITRKIGDTLISVNLILPLGGAVKGTFDIDIPLKTLQRRTVIVSSAGALSNLIVGGTCTYLLYAIIPHVRIKYIWSAMFYGSATWSEIAVGLFALWCCLSLGDVIGVFIPYRGSKTDGSRIIDYFLKRNDFAQNDNAEVIQGI